MALTDTTTPISLPLSNMYADGRTIVYSDGSAILVRDLISYEAQTNDTYYTVRIGDVITGIAYKSYKANVSLPQHYWWIICDANNIKNPLDLTALVGKKILIPNILNFKVQN